MSPGKATEVPTETAGWGRGAPALPSAFPTGLQRTEEGHRPPSPSPRAVVTVRSPGAGVRCRRSGKSPDRTRRRALHKTAWAAESLGSETLRPASRGPSVPAPTPARPGGDFGAHREAGSPGDLVGGPTASPDRRRPHRRRGRDLAGPAAFPAKVGGKRSVGVASGGGAARQPIKARASQVSD